jgi:hypothetical protein
LFNLHETIQLDIIGRKRHFYLFINGIQILIFTAEEKRCFVKPTGSQAHVLHAHVVYAHAVHANVEHAYVMHAHDVNAPVVRRMFSFRINSNMTIVAVG